MSNDLLALARNEIVEMLPYRSARSEKAYGNIWLDANENPWQEGHLYNRYPEPQPSSLLQALALLYQVRPDQLLITRGSDEGIDLLIRLFCRAHVDHIMITPPTYGMYKVAATIQGASVIEVPLIKVEGFSLNTVKTLECWQPNTKLIFLCSPNNPTGNLLAVQDILLLCKAFTNQSIIIVDEAYVEFSGKESLVKYLNDFPNLVLLRTLSKAYGLAGTRCGVTLAAPSIIALLKKIIAPYPIPRPIVDIAEKQLNAQTIKDQINKITQEKKRVFKYLSSLSFVKKVWKSDANFLLFEVANTSMVLNYCLKAGIVLRDRSGEYNLNNCIRVTIGTPDENTKLMEVLNDF
jgi:histidinol-phosphate aminotransferase